ncbi:hypothetical protein CVT24_001746 [Panaeolus cyanescens]|uniref:Uncharacterized protein n=1 Tax=Panaeolus cyanescens TaxID=181874 RepID=A0A409WJ90_9AGAR|nr:hypothetical protein CVT24_001746 [Panaeolus cyanescens]
MPISSISGVRFASPVEQKPFTSPRITHPPEVGMMRPNSPITTSLNPVTQQEPASSQERSTSALSSEIPNEHLPQDDEAEDDDNTEKYVEEDLTAVSGPRIIAHSETFRYFEVKVFFPSSIPLFHFTDQTMENKVGRRQREVNELAEHYLGRTVKRAQSRLNRAERKPFIKAYDLLMEAGDE